MKKTMLQEKSDDMATASPGLLRRAGLRLLKAAHLTSRPARRMRLLESLTCGRQAQVFLIEIDGKNFLAGGGSDAIQALLALPGESL